jgi:hypothetical protein
VINATVSEAIGEEVVVAVVAVEVVEVAVEVAAEVVIAMETVAPAKTVKMVSDARMSKLPLPNTRADSNGG